LLTLTLDVDAFDGDGDVNPTVDALDPLDGTSERFRRRLLAWCMGADVDASNVKTPKRQRPRCGQRRRRRQGQRCPSRSTSTSVNVNVVNALN